MIGKLLCWLGIHDPKVIPVPDLFHPSLTRSFRIVCRCCGRQVGGR